MMKRHILLYIALIVAGIAMGQTLQVNAPKHVEAGEQFRLQYSISTDNVSNIRLGNIPEALEVLYGPSKSSQSSWQMVNGHTSSSSSTTFTFLLCANKKGSYTIPAAYVKVGDKVIRSNAVHITVSGNASSSNGNQGRSNSNDESEQRMEAAGTPVSSQDLFIRVSANKTRVHEQEPVLLTYKVYTLVDLTQLEGKMPDLTGFHTQEVSLPQQKSFHIERVNGRNYRCVTWSQYVMYPQMTGALKIPSIVFKGIVVQENRSVDPFEAFFNGGSGYIEVKKNITAPGLTIQVDPLPKRPADFSGGVGKFNITAQLNKTDIKTGDPLNLRVIVGGVGNLKLIKQPVVSFPKDFDKYDAKVTDKTKLTANGVEGNMIYDFMAVPNNKGQYTIPPVEFTYYDTAADGYKTIKTQAFTINVEQGSGRSTVSDYADQKDKDIRQIKEGKANLHDANDFFFGSTTYLMLHLLLIAAFAALLIIFRKRAVERANIGKMRGKKANKIATKRLRKAHQLMLKDRQSEFYDEVLRALWGYVGDKMNMRIEELSRDNISEKLTAKGVEDDTISMFISALDECEFERYAPGDAKGNMNKTYDMAMSAIMKIEDAMKARKKNKGANVSVVLLLMLLLPISVNAITTKKNADNEYKHGNYQQAVKDYEELLRSGKVNADVFYNLGNAYYRMDNITSAVLNYERALMLSPGDQDIRFNLQMARSKTIDKITPESEMFFVTWFHSLVYIMSVDGWAYTSLFAVLAALVLFLVYLFTDRMILRKTGFFGGILMIALFVLSNIFAYQQRRQFEERSGAIVIAPSVTVKATPAQNGKDAFTIHEGTKVHITDRTMKDWRAIRLDDGREGWLLSNKIEEI